MVFKKVSCTAPINIAVIKYWGKIDEDLIIPANDSISFTLSQDEMCAKTTIVISPSITKSHFWLNGSYRCQISASSNEKSLENTRILNCIEEVQKRARINLECNDGDASILNWKMHISSTNNFPTAAGLASSAAGLACLAFTLAKIYDVEGDLTPIARLGSGSACRSMHGGMVQWEKGVCTDGSDSVARQIASFDHWDDLHVIICITNDKKKKIGSTEGMKLSMKTSELMKHRCSHSVIKRIAAMKTAITKKDWGTFCDLTMTDSNEMHAICLSTFPPCVYMNDTSHELCHFVHSFNKQFSVSGMTTRKICYTFDAGPNCVLFVPQSSLEEIVSLLDYYFPSKNSTTKPTEQNYWTGIPISLPLGILKDSPVDGIEIAKSHSIMYFIHTKIGDGPRICDEEVTDLPDGFHSDKS